MELRPSVRQPSDTLTHNAPQLRTEPYLRFADLFIAIVSSERRLGEKRAIPFSKITTGFVFPETVFFCCQMKKNARVHSCEIGFLRQTRNDRGQSWSSEIMDSNRNKETTLIMSSQIFGNFFISRVSLGAYGKRVERRSMSPSFVFRRRPRHLPSGARLLFILSAADFRQSASLPSFHFFFRCFLLLTIFVVFVVAGRLESDSEEEEHDSELDDFIDDGPEEGANDYSKYIQEIFGARYRRIVSDDEDENDCMETSYAAQMREERISTRLGTS